MQTHKELADRLAKRLLENFTSDQIRLVTDNLMILLENFDITEKTTAIVTQDSDIKTRALQMFFVSKKMEGCTDNTIRGINAIVIHGDSLTRKAKNIFWIYNESNNAMGFSELYEVPHTEKIAEMFGVIWENE